MSKPLISVMMPAYNAAETISAAIDSIMAQTLTEWELVCFDDGSTDATAAIVERYAQQDPRIKLIRGQHGGRGRARNEVLKACTGIYIAIQDADDISFPERFEIQTKYLAENLEISAVGSSMLAFNGKLNDELLTKIPYPINSTEIANTFNRLRMGIANACSMIRRECFDEVGGYDERLLRAQDFGFFLKLHHAGAKFYNFEQPLLYYRQNSSSNIPSYQYWSTSEKYHWLAIELSGLPLSWQQNFKYSVFKHISWVRYSFFYLKRALGRG